MTRRTQAISVLQASQESPILGQLSALASDSAARLKAIQGLLPATLRPAIHAGPIEGSTWCLVVNNNACAAKLKQLLPALQAHLRTKGWDVETIRLKVKSSQERY